MPDIHQALSSMLSAGKFEPFIRHIRFPHFRNLQDGTRIDFSHPITALVGPNGTNKTAALRALQGCPENANIGQYWFSTTLDPITSGERHRFIHGYLAQSVGEVVEVVKSRISRPDDPDYWEPARPLVTDNMAKMLPFDESADNRDRTKTRWKAVTKNIVYLDFRSELSAYDKYFFHLPVRRKAAIPAAKKSHIRKRSVHLSDSINQRRKSHLFDQSERVLRPAVALDKAQTDAISEILGRRYDSIDVIFHRYFDVDGATVVLRAANLRYSEAFAGSGEFAVVMLVKAITEASPASLVLLDEPEVSLHPGAQRKLMAFIAKETKAKNHQVVISTHSPEIVRDLPSDAIKVFQRNDVDGRVELVAQASDPADAFFRLGVQVENKRFIFVEDALAAEVVRYAIQPLGHAANARAEIMALPGGAQAIQRLFIPNFALSQRTDCLVLLDGDQRPETPIQKSSEIAESALEKAVADVLGEKLPLPLNGSGGVASPGGRSSQLQRILDWVQNNLDYLPGETPEGLILTIEGQMAQEGQGGKDVKNVWAERARAALAIPSWDSPKAPDILAEQKRALARLDHNDDKLDRIRSRVQHFLNFVP